MTSRRFGRIVASAATCLCLCLCLFLALAAVARPARAADDPFAWAPPRAPAVSLGRQVGERFGLLGLHELDVEIDNVFDAANRQALELAERRLGEIPGVRAVYGPADLLDVTVDQSGNPSARAVMARGASESESEAARQRVVRRADALGWFLTENGRRARFYVDAEDWGPIQPKLAAALEGSGLDLAATGAGALEIRPVWPDPRQHRARFLPLGFAAVWVFFVLVAAARASFHPGRRRWACAVAAAAGAAAPFALVPVGGVRLAGGLAALVAMALVLLEPTRPGGAAVRHRERPRSFGVALVLAAALVLEVGLFAPRLRVGTRQWRAAPMFFLSLRGDLGEPVVLREVRRLTDYLRAQPGVANAWSAADLFMGVTFEGEEASGIPSDPELTRRILLQAERDPAIRLELSADHQTGLIGVRFDDDPTVDRLVLVQRLERYLELDLRSSLLHVNLGAGDLSPVTQLLGEGLLAGDAGQRVLRICARSGRSLSAPETAAVARASRAAALLPSADVPRLDAELADAVRDFVARHPVPLAASATERLIGAADALDTEGTDDEVAEAVNAAYGARVSDPVLRSTTASFERRLAAVRRRHTARIDFKEMLYGADLPTEGVLADEVRSATLEAMGPVVGIPVPPETPGAFHLAAEAIGGAPNDRALSAIWNRALRAGLVAAAGIVAILLLLVGGPAGLASLPLAFAPLAAAVAPSVLLGEPVGLPAISFFCGALAGGALLAVLVTPRAGAGRRRR